MIDFLAAAIRIATPLLLAALGGILSERAGVFAVGLEGMMLAGAFAAVVAAWASGSDTIGIVMAMAGGAVIGLAVAVVAVRYRADNMVTGLTANILALGLTSYLLRIVAGEGGRPAAIHLSPLAPWPIPGLADIPVVGPLLFVQPPLTYLAVIGCFGLAWFLNRTQAGLTLRATGENPEAVFASGAEPLRVRIIAVIACGAIAGLGGAVLSLQQVGTFTDGMTGGRGYLALASLIVGRWSPWGAAAACLVFGAAEAFEIRLQSFGVPVGSYIVHMAPYLIALAVLAGLGRSSRLPAAIGQPLARE
jgi:simple sugar transport system permease protein